MSSQKANKIYIVCPFNKYNINGFLYKIKSLRTRFENEGLEYFPDCYFAHQEILELLDPQTTTIDEAESYNHYIKNIFNIDTQLYDIIYNNIILNENEQIILNNREEIKLTEHEAIILNNREEIKFIYVCNEYDKDILCNKYLRTFKDFDMKIIYEKDYKNINNIETNNYSLSVPINLNIEKLYDSFYEHNKSNEIKYKILLVTPIDFNPIGIDSPDEESWWTFETINNELIKYKEKLDKLWK